MADVFNLFNQQIVLDYDNFFDLDQGRRAEPELRHPVVRDCCRPQYQTPRQVRFGVRFAF